MATQISKKVAVYVDGNTVTNKFHVDFSTATVTVTGFIEDREFNHLMTFEEVFSNENPFLLEVAENDYDSSLDHDVVADIIATRLNSKADTIKFVSETWNGEREVIAEFTHMRNAQDALAWWNSEFPNWHAELF